MSALCSGELKNKIIKQMYENLYSDLNGKRLSLNVSQTEGLKTIGFRLEIFIISYMFFS